MEFAARVCASDLAAVGRTPADFRISVRLKLPKEMRKGLRAERIWDLLATVSLCLKNSWVRIIRFIQPEHGGFLTSNRWEG